MKLDSRLTALEANLNNKSLCTVYYKAGQGPSGGEEGLHLPIDKALKEAKTGHVKSIELPLTFNEQQAEYLYGRGVLEKAFRDIQEGTRRDTDNPSFSSLILCSKPILYAKQAPPVGRVGGYFVTEDGEVFHQTHWREMLEKHKAGFIIVTDYDESKEPWYQPERSKP